ncbi:DUF2461 domain-containing protein [Pontibacter diazotrophicus]|uniref:DUF2461 domain-containing protein n=1 Tax=Pontibacter diazotrophicus TaxID=1400979 RepID=A0A3D8L7T5_9BACT|nr:DUF2461 domain-containing protein [Pontibacter diazotrophicus]RDV13393.1 DUF2461 domain-containing protein [Pontibacter diazotrophicus]
MDTRTVLKFLQSLQHNNSKLWMDSHREEYQQAKFHFTALVNHLLEALQHFDSDLHGVTAQECIFRINKNDFSKKGEPPYKGHFGAGMSPGGRHSPFANYVLVLEPNGKSRAGGGIRKPTSKQLELIREEIDYSPGELQGILQEPAFKAAFGGLQGEKRKLPPKGYDKAHQEIALLKHNSFQVLHYFTDEEVCAPDFIARLLPLYRQVVPLHHFLNRSITENK